MTYLCEMADVHSKETRSYNMSHIRSKDTKPELRVRKYLFVNGFRYRLHIKNLPGTPDIVLSKYRVIINVQGCFWHGHGCKYFKIPETRREWWVKKINLTVVRDMKNESLLKELGWDVINVWECELKSRKEHRLEELIREIKKEQ